MVATLAFAALAALAPMQQVGSAPGEVRGLIRSEATGERLPYSVIEMVGAERTLVTMADSTGAYILRDIPPGRRLLRVSRFDHAPLEVEILVPPGRGVVLDVLLVRQPVALPEIAAHASLRPALSDTRNPPVPELSVAVARAIEATPGMIELGLGQVSPGGSPGQEPVDPSDVLYVRGAPADLKLVLLDGAPVYAPFHLGGLIQPFDPALLRSAELYLGGAPARYDGGLSYVLGLETRAGQRSRVRGSGAADLLSAQALVEGPISRRAGFLAAGRAVHSWGARWILDRGFPYDYADFLGRLDADVGEAGGIALTGFWNDESVRLDEETTGTRTARWGNAAASLRYRGALLGGDLDLTAAYGGYRARLPLGGAQAVMADGSARRVRLSADLTRGGGSARVQYGLSYEKLVLDYEARPEAADGDALVLETASDGEVGGAYVDVDWRPGSRWRIRGGGRVDVFSSDAVARFAPRISATWLASDRVSLTVAAGRYRQFFRSAEPVLVVGEDSAEALYVPPPLAVAHASHLVIALDQELGEGVRLGIEGFFKTFDDVPRPDTAAAGSGRPVQVTRTGAARASGVDLWLRRGEGRLTGWLGYSLGWVWTDGDPAEAERFAGRQLLSVGLSGPLGARGRFDLHAAYGAGLPYAAIPQVQFADAARALDAPSVASAGVTRLQSLTINSPPLSSAPDDPYFRVDIEVSHPWSATWRRREFTFTPYFKVLNALDRRDALFYHVRGDADEPDPLAALPILPIIGFRWSF